MKSKELTLTAILIAVMIVQSFALFSFPITLTYTILYFLTQKLAEKKLPFLAVLVFVIAKNIIMPALIPTIMFDLIGLMIFVVICLIPLKIVRYILIPITIIIHILLLDLSTIILTVNVITNFKDIIILWGAQISLGFVTYIYAPLSIVLILMLEGLNYLSDLELTD